MSGKQSIEYRHFLGGQIGTLSVTEEEASGQYIPGSCNIGREEIRRRYRIGYIGIVFALIVAIFIHLTNAHRIWKLFLFIPVFYSVSGFIQAVNKFCYFYGLRQVFSLDGIRKFTKVKDEQLIKRDRKKAIQIVMMVTICSVAITAIYYLLF